MTGANLYVSGLQLRGGHGWGPWVGIRRRRREGGMLVIDFENLSRHVSRPSDTEVALVEYATYVDVNPPKRPKRGSWDGPAKVETQTAHPMPSATFEHHYDVQASNPSLKVST